MFYRNYETMFKLFNLPIISEHRTIAYKKYFAKCAFP